MEQKLISICIPTYNRAPFLKECLESITAQFSDQRIQETINIFILDNQSADNTKNVAESFTSKFDNILYIRDEQKRDISRGISKAASYGDGEYIWVFSDDDLQTSESISTIIKNIENEKPDVIINNLNSFFGKLEKIQKNILKINHDYYLKNRKELFKYLNKKIFSNVDFYTTFCSNTLLKKTFLDKNSYILEKFNGPMDLFPFHAMMFYSDAQFTTKIISSTLLFIRGDNESWGSRNKIKHYFYRSKLWRYHYNNIIRLNRKDLPIFFPLKIKIKNFLEIKNLIIFFLVTFLKKIYLYKITKFFYYKLKGIKKTT